jgi:hypothetical protein
VVENNKNGVMPIDTDKRIIDINYYYPINMRRKRLFIASGATLKY